MSAAMNYLAHLYLADYTQTSLAGSVLGDAVKGRLNGEYPPTVEQGIRLHRRIDTFTDTHPGVQAACAHFEPPYRRYAGILLDIYFDYLLVQRWPRLPAPPLQQFAHEISAKLWAEWPYVPLTRERMANFPDVLLSYGTPDGIKTALQRVANRAKRNNPMAGALPVLQANHSALASAFDAFFPELEFFAAREAKLPTVR